MHVQINCAYLSLHEIGFHVEDVMAWIMGKCLATILILAVTVVFKLRFENSLELAYKPEA